MAETYPDSTNLKFKELLKEVQLDYSPENTAIINDAVSGIREAIDHIPDDGLLVTADDVAAGFIRDVGADKVDFKFVKPKSIEIGGSYAFQCVAMPDVNVDIFLRLPKECFHEKDYLNYRYHSKRFLYLCMIKKYLKNSSSILDVKWSAFQNEARKPVLIVYPAARLSDNTVFSLKIIPTAPSLFTLSKLNMERNNIRVLDQATPKYNSSILEDMFIEENAEFIKRTFKGRKELGEALLLLKVWARKRFLFVHDCLSGFLTTIIVAYLASRSGKSRITNSMSAMQILRITLDFIANSKLWDSGLFFQPEGERNISDKDRKTNLQSFPIIVCDSFGNYNMAFRMSPSGFQELRDEAVLALACMDKCNDMGFDEIFMTKIDYPTKYDYCIRLNLKGNHNFHDSGFCLNDECWRSYEQKVLDVIDQALKGRTKLIRVVWRNIPSDCNFENGLSMLDGVPLFIGITIGSIEEAFKQAVVGPSPEDKDKALAFRKFWGDKATLRWFRDGKIAEVAVWEHEEWEKHLIIKEICEHVLMRHLALPKQSIICTVDQLDFVLHHGNRDPISCSKSLMKAYDDLSKHLRLLDDIPLKISSVQPLDSAFRLTSVFPPAPHPLANEGSNIKLEKHTLNCIQPLEVMIQLEGSGNWPMDELAMEKTKTAFLLRISESLQTKLGITCTATEDDVDVFMSGYAFRLKILHERGLSLVKNHGGQIKRVLSSDKKLFLRGQHSSMVNGLRGRYPIYGPVVRLAKRWVSAHLFSNSLSEEVIELLVAHLFLKPLPFRLPCSRITGFLRFLRLLSKYDWSFCPLIVDINSDLTPDDDKEIIENFMSNRKQYEENLQNVKPAMFLASSYDRESEAWTGQSPTATDLKRLAAYANSSANFLTDIITSNKNESYGWEQCLFRTPLNNYNAVILLHRDKLPYPHHLLFPSEVKQGRHIVRGKPSKSFQPLLLREDMKGNLEELKSKLMVGFDPLKYFVVDIEREFADTFKVWYDSFGGDAIGLTCGNNKSSKKRARDDTDDGKDLVDALKAVGELGKGFVKSVHFLKAPKANNT